MSDRSSESSCEWIVLNEDEEDLSLENHEQPLNLEVNYDAICNAVSDSIRSSLSGEELEWQYEQFDFIPPYESSHVEELGLRHSDTESNESEDSNVEDDIISKFASSDIEDEDLDLSHISKIHCYKHNRNDHLNYVLNLLLALAIASAVGLGTGHFLGWSHKCFKSESNKAAVYLPEVVKMEQNIKGIDDSEKQMMSASHVSENLSNSISCLNSKDESSSEHDDTCSAPMSSNIITDTVISETPIHVTTNVLELKTQDELLLNSSEHSNIPHVPNIIMPMDWNDLSDIDASIQKFYGLKKITSDNVIDSFHKDEVNNIELSKEYYTKEGYTGNKGIYNDKTADVKNNLFHNDELNNDESEFLKQFLTKNRDSDKKGNLTSQLRSDLNEVIQSLTAIALTRLTDFDEKYVTSIEDAGIVIKLYHDFQNLINTRITDIDNFVLNTEYKKYQKVSINYLEKMVYSLVDSVDYLMKVSFKTLSHDSRKINVYKFSNNISKVIFNFNKKWEKNSRYWTAAVEKAKFRETKERYFRKDNKQFKRKYQFERDFRNYKYRRYSVKL